MFASVLCLWRCAQDTLLLSVNGKALVGDDVHIRSYARACVLCLWRAVSAVAVAVAVAVAEAEAVARQTGRARAVGLGGVGAALAARGRPALFAPRR